MNHGIDAVADTEIAAASAAHEQRQRAAAWREKWPNFCKSCRGWGGSVFYQSHPYGSTSAQEPLLELCDAIADPSICHRCQNAGLDEDGEGPCKACGWSYDDGEPPC